MTYEALSDHQLLIEFFRSNDGQSMGAYGDYHGYTPAQTAIHYLRKAQHDKRRNEIDSRLATLNAEVDQLVAERTELNRSV